jgi:hypothetical protein
MVLASPVIAVLIHRDGVPHNAAHYRLLAAAIDKAWRSASHAPLRLIGSSTDLGNGLAFYVPNQPSVYDLVQPERTPWIDQARIAQDGIALACSDDDFRCKAAADRMLTRFPSGRRSEVGLARTYLGVRGPAARYHITAIPPSSAQ